MERRVQVVYRRTEQNPIIYGFFTVLGMGLNVPQHCVKLYTYAAQLFSVTVQHIPTLLL